MQSFIPKKTFKRRNCGMYTKLRCSCTQVQYLMVMC